MNLKNTDVLKGLLIFFVIAGLANSANAEFITTVGNESLQNIPGIYLKPEMVEIRPFERAVIDLVLVNGSSVGVLDIGIEYDGDVVEIANVSSKYNFEYLKSIAYNSHLIHFLNIRVFLENESIENQSTIASITLKGVNEGKTILRFSHRSDVYDRNGKLMGCAFMSSTKVTVKAVNKAEINFSENIISLDPFETANVNIILKNGSKINTLKISLEYNRNIIRVENVTSHFRIEDIELKGETLNMTILTSGELSDNATSIANLTIKALSKGFTVIGISRVEGYDVNGNPVYLSRTSPYGVEIIVSGALPEGPILIEPIMELMFAGLIAFMAILAVVLVVVLTMVVGVVVVTVVVVVGDFVVVDVVDVVADGVVVVVVVVITVGVSNTLYILIDALTPVYVRIKYSPLNTAQALGLPATLPILNVILFTTS